MAQKKRGPGRPPGSKNKTKKSTSGTGNTSAGGRHDLSSSRPTTQSRVIEEIGAIVILALGAFLVIALQTKFAGAVGTFFADFLKGCFGFGAYFLPYILIVYAILIFIKIAAPFRTRTMIIMIIVFLMADLINAGRFITTMEVGILGVKDVYAQGVELMNGGVFGMFAGGGIYDLIGIYGLYIFAGVVILICLLLLLNTPISRFFEKAKVKRETMAKQRALEDEEEMKRRAEREKRWAQDALEKTRKKAEERQGAGNGKQEEFDFVPEEKPMTVPPRMPHVPDPDDYYTSEPKEMTEGQKNILDLMKTDDLFSGEKNTPLEGQGLKDDSLIVSSKGRDADERAEDGYFDGEASDEGGRIGSPGSGRTAGTAGMAGGMTGGAMGAAAIGGRDGKGAKPVTEGDGTHNNTYPHNYGRYIFPPLNLLKEAPFYGSKKGLGDPPGERAALLEETLKSFNVEARVTNVIEGPSVTRYEIQPSTGVKVQKIVNLADDIALNLRAKSLRMEAPIPGKAAVGIEIENEQREIVSLREIIGSKEFRTHKSKLVFTVGKDIGGNAIVADLAKMPHLLIAGATGSGKSVCINTIITSILYKARPEEVKLVLIDPKMVELGSYNGIPHLLIPVVTDASKAAAALGWAVGEMTGRYKKFASEGVRDINSYNSVMKARKQKEDMLPQIVVIIDELADLMMVASSQVEDAICRLAQLARGAGMHLIVATQRPSVDVITGLIKANIPSRVAFMVSSQIDSRTIIDMPGAEKLVGNGDMLFKPQDLNKPKRIQAPFISDGEVRSVIEFVKNQTEGEVEYAGEVIKHIEKGNTYDPSEEDDELMAEATECVVMAGQASVSMLQRRFRIGYNRAARIIDMMEARGIIGPADGSKPRMVIMTEDELRDGEN